MSTLKSPLSKNASSGMAHASPIAFTNTNLPAVTNPSLHRTIAHASMPDALSPQSTRPATRNVRLVGAFRGSAPLRILSIQGVGSATRLRQSQIGGIWEFFSNRLFRFTPRGIGTIVRDDLFPVVGTYRLSRNSIRISGQRSSSIGLGGGAAVFIDGIFARAQNGQVFARIIQSTTASSAFVGIGGPISGGSRNTYDFTIRMARIVGNLLR